MNDDLPRPGPDSDTDDMHPAKRRRRNSSENAAAKIPRVKMERRRPPRLWKQLREISRKRQANENLAFGKAESMIPTAPSIAPSCAEPLPEKLIPRTKNAWCERWRETVAMGEDYTPPQQSLNNVTLQVYDSITGSETGDFVHVDDYTCPSCCPSSPPLSPCSLTEEEIAMWTPKPVEDMERYALYHWN